MIMVAVVELLSSLFLELIVVFAVEVSMEEVGLV
jgi:hypothetical protein